MYKATLEFVEMGRTLEFRPLHISKAGSMRVTRVSTTQYDWLISALFDDRDSAGESSFYFAGDLSEKITYMNTYKYQTILKDY